MPNRIVTTNQTHAIASHQWIGVFSILFSENWYFLIVYFGYIYKKPQKYTS